MTCIYPLEITTFLNFPFPNSQPWRSFQFGVYVKSSYIGWVVPPPTKDAGSWQMKV